MSDLFVFEGATDDQLSNLLYALRRDICEAPDGMWSFEALHAARTLTEAICDHIREMDDRRWGGP